jgi:hypothetical protein
MEKDADLRQHLAALLDSGDAHIRFSDALADFPLAQAGVRPAGSPHSAWELLEHMRIALADIVLFSRGEGYVELKWPDEYWPVSPAPASRSEWENSLQAVCTEVAKFIDMLKDPSRDLLEPFAWGSGQTLLREALLIADHNAYHLGQLVLLRRMLEASATRP